MYYSLGLLKTLVYFSVCVCLFVCVCVCLCVCLVMSNSLHPQGLQSTSLLCP